ncbi:XRE family transcriptional regulator [Kitasatospora sp. NPDC085895]|uniref:XRE family transcriptional regulator n=1 Tax=Kitasatospora sp. NPDC085895 TaxID=3155057 RepID=UPI00344D53D5
MDDRPSWAQRMVSERAARGWSQTDAIDTLRAHSTQPLPGAPSLLRMWKRWEAGEAFPRDYQALIARTFGTTTHAFFPKTGRRDGGAEIIYVAGMDTADIVARLRASDIDQATLDALTITVDRLCTEYAYMPSDQLLAEGRQWLGRIAGMQHQRLSLAQHRELLVQADMLTLLVGCVEYDSGDRYTAEATRRAALSIGEEAGHAAIAGWAHEIRAWMCLTGGDYRGVLQAADSGIASAPAQSVAVQLYAQKAKAWARLGDRQQTEVALDAGRRLLEDMPYPDNIESHFVVDPAKYDFYRMDCYRRVGEDRLAEQLAREVLRAGTDYDGTERAPMRNAEARVTLGVVAARAGDLETAVSYGEQALGGPRRSIPSLVMVSEDLGTVLQQQYSGQRAAEDFLGHLRSLRVA